MTEQFVSVEITTSPSTSERIVDYMKSLGSSTYQWSPLRQRPGDYNGKKGNEYEGNELCEASHESAETAFESFG